MTQSEAGKGSDRRPESEHGDFDEGWELLHGGWEIMTEDPPGQPHEVRRMRGKLWWRPLRVAQLWKRSGCGDLVPENYKECPHCKTKRESK
jgi:hypothetical protein